MNAPIGFTIADRDFHAPLENATARGGAYRPGPGGAGLAERRIRHLDDVAPCGRSRGSACSRRAGRCTSQPTRSG